MLAWRSISPAARNGLRLRARAEAHAATTAAARRAGAAAPEARHAIGMILQQDRCLRRQLRERAHLARKSQSVNMVNIRRELPQ